MDVARKSVLVVGGASGLGEATARHLAAEGAAVTVADRDEKRGSFVADEISGSFQLCDITDEGEVEGLFASLTGPPLVAVVNCAGIGPPRRLLDRDGNVHPLRTFDLIMRVNVYGTFNVLRFGARKMSNNQPNLDGERGVIVNTSSTSAFEGQVGQVAFAAAKGGVAALTLPAARDLAVVGIRVAAIVPGLMATPAAETMTDANRAAVTEQVVFPKRLGLPPEYASLAAHIIANSYVNGAVFRVDAALRTPPK
jgi:3-hydroxyacyl-CoA dehydrogenase / 3-hydroxy-2-methylbutyryl-CoA dehydrogenase